MGFIPRAILIGALGLLATSGARAGSEVRLRPVPRTVAPEPAVGGEGWNGISLQLGSTLPFANPYKAIVGKNLRSFRFQTSTAFLLEYAYGLTPNWELGVSSGYESLTSRAETGTILTEFETARLSQVPVRAIARYRLIANGWSPEFEAGAGWSFGSFRFASTNLSVPTKAQSQSFFVGHAAIGAGFPWTDEIALHLRGGVNFAALGSRVFKTTLLDIQQGSLLGLYLRADFRFQF
jgi:hypothetical protein